MSFGFRWFVLAVEYRQMMRKWAGHRGVAGTLLAAGLFWGWAGWGGAEKREAREAAADALFSSGVVLRVELEIPRASLASLRNGGRKYVPAILREGGQAFKVLLHVKGGAGSYRSIDDKPGLTVKLEEGPSDVSFHGLKKFHLNNSVQDGSFLSEWLCSGLFRSAGVPAGRTAHALVTLNGRQLGLYVVVENVNRDFLRRYFRNTQGNVYGQSPNADVTEALEKVGGRDVAQYQDLRALASAARERDLARLRERLPQVLDLERFVSFVAVETLLDHWDGYTFNVKNYLVYHDLDTGRMVFIPHDMDQVLRDSNRPIVPRPVGIVSAAILRIPEVRQRYLARFREITTNFFVPAVLNAQIDARLAQLLPVLEAYDPNLVVAVYDNANDLKSRIIRRARVLQLMTGTQAAGTLRFVGQSARPQNWRVANELGDARFARTRDEQGKFTLWIAATGRTCSSWRAKVRLEAGRYAFEGLARTLGVRPIRDDKGEGVGLRISGSQQPRQNQLSGDSPWRKLVYEFEVGAPDEEVELVCELRATQGQVWFDLESLRLVRLQ